MLPTDPSTHYNRIVLRCVTAVRCGVIVVRHDTAQRDTKRYGTYYYKYSTLHYTAISSTIQYSAGERKWIVWRQSTRRASNPHRSAHTTIAERFIAVRCIAVHHRAHLRCACCVRTVVLQTRSYLPVCMKDLRVINRAPYYCTVHSTWFSHLQ